MRRCNKYVSLFKTPNRWPARVGGFFALLVFFVTLHIMKLQFHWESYGGVSCGPRQLIQKISMSTLTDLPVHLNQPGGYSVSYTFQINNILKNKTPILLPHPPGGQRSTTFGPPLQTPSTSIPITSQDTSFPSNRPPLPRVLERPRNTGPHAPPF